MPRDSVCKASAPRARNTTRRTIITFSQGNDNTGLHVTSLLVLVARRFYVLQHHRSLPRPLVASLHHPPASGDLNYLHKEHCNLRKGLCKPILPPLPFPLSSYPSQSEKEIVTTRDTVKREDWHWTRVKWMNSNKINDTNDVKCVAKVLLNPKGTLQSDKLSFTLGVCPLFAWGVFSWGVTPWRCFVLSSYPPQTYKTLAFTLRLFFFSLRPFPKTTKMMMSLSPISAYHDYGAGVL